jgi:2,4-dienoyl-CoA reductase-like NADH-dependent reductase (Old Yellow Enzyme family)
MTQPALFAPIDLRSVSIRNRIWISPMCQYSVEKKDGVPTDWHLVHLGGFASGGAGLVITEATAVNPEGRISPWDTGLWNDEQRDSWSRIVEFLHSQGAKAGVQLAHAGRKASTWRPWAERHGTIAVEDGGWAPVAPSAVAFGEYAVPDALDLDGIATVTADFIAAARRAVDAGFDVIELHAAHGYLLHQFLSPLSNLRSDQYGGSLENRARLLLEVVASVRAEVGDDIAVLVRFSATDYAEGGFTTEQTAIVAGWARDAGADFFDISSGGLVTGVTIPLAPGYQVPYAEFVGEEADVEVGSVGLITDAQQADDIVSSGRADAVLIAREALRDPHFPLRAARELGYDLPYWPEQYVRAKL